MDVWVGELRMPRTGHRGTRYDIVVIPWGSVGPRRRRASGGARWLFGCRPKSMSHGGFGFFFSAVGLANVFLQSVREAQLERKGVLKQASSWVISNEGSSRRLVSRR